MLKEGTLAAVFYLGDPLHSLDSCLYQLAVVADGNISSFLKVDGGVLKNCEKDVEDDADSCVQRSFPCLQPS